MMTREEAIEILQWYVDDAGISSKDFNEALDMALTALRPITREQVEKVWRGCELCQEAEKVIGIAYSIPGECDKQEIRAYYMGEENGMYTWCKLEYCPSCGRPLTDKAVDMVMERLEEVYASDT